MTLVQLKRRPKGFSSLGAVLLRTCLLASLLGACGVSTSTTLPVSGTQVEQASSQHLTVSFVVPVPPGFDRPSVMAGDLDAAGVWYWSASRSDSRIFHWDATTHVLSSWSIEQVPGVRTVSGASAMAVGADGTVWLGLNLTLVHLHPADGAIQSFAIPVPQDNAAAEGYRPPELRGLHAVQALAVGPRGVVAVGLSASDSITLFHAKTATFSEIALPPPTEANSLTFTSSGLLVAGLNNYSSHQVDQLFLSTLAAGEVVTVADASGVSSYGDSVVAGARTPSVMTLSTSMVESHSRPSVSGVAGGPFSAAASAGARMLSHGMVAVADGQDVRVVGDGATRIAVLPSYRCAPNPPAGPRPTAPQVSPTLGTCQATVEAMTSDGAGNLWISSTGNEAYLARVAVGS